MPSLELFGRRWKVGSDDFVYPMISENVIRFFWFILMLTVVIIYRNDLALCQRNLLVKAYCTGVLLILAINIFFNFVLMKNSMKGNIFDESSVRRLVPCMVAGKILLFVPEIIWICLGTALMFSDLIGCPSALILILKITLGFSWGLLLLLIFFIILAFDPLGNPAKRDEVAQASKIWKWRCRLWCCWLKQNEVENDSFDEISYLMASYFHGFDVTVTDIAAGLFLLNEKQKLREPTNKNMLSPYDMSYSANTTNAGLKQEEWMNLDSAKHFMKFALASYGWMFFVYDKTLVGTSQLCCTCSIPCKGSGNIQGDKCCHINTNAIIKQTGIDYKDIIYASFENKLFEIPFYVALDHKYKSIVVAVRGTLSFYDAITDLRIDSENVNMEFDFEALAHKGILQASTYIKNTIIEKNLLSEAIALYPDYRLVVTGHSLGAGAASLVSLLLKPIYKNLICFAFSPPGWLVSYPLSQYMESFVCSIVVGKDLVPRMGVYTMKNLKYELIMVLKQSQLPKYRILFRAFKKMCCKSKKRLFGDQLLQEDSVSIPPDFQESHPILGNPTPLCLPGKIIYLESESTIKTCCSKRNIYKAYWAKKEFFDEILVSPKMVSEHRPDVVYKALKSATN